MSLPECLFWFMAVRLGLLLLGEILPRRSLAGDVAQEYRASLDALAARHPSPAAIPSATNVGQMAGGLTTGAPSVSRTKEEKPS